MAQEAYKSHPLWLRPGVEALEGTIAEQDARILFYFGTDCGERALLRQKRLGREPDALHLKTLEDKRRWLQSPDERRELPSAGFITYAMDTSCFGLHREQVPEELWVPIWSAASAAAWSSQMEPIAVALRSSALARKAAAADAQLELQWQCRRLAWWLALHQWTSRLWLAYEAECPLPPPAEIQMDFGFDALEPQPFPSGQDPFLRG